MVNKNAVTDDDKKLLCSAFKDEALTPSELELVLSLADTDPDFRKDLVKYQMISDFVQGKVNQFSTVDISQAVRAKVDAIPENEKNSVLSSDSRKTPFEYILQKFGFLAELMMWRKLLGGAFVFFVGWIFIFQLTNVDIFNNYPIKNEFFSYIKPQMGRIFEKAPNKETAGNSALLDVPASSGGALLKRKEKRVRAYVLQHVQLVAMYQGQSVFPFARLATQNLLPVYQEE